VERAEKSEWNKYYTDRYGVTESTPNGYFTAACGQLIYRADVLPEPYRDNLFACEPAQNMIHRCLIHRDGLRFEVRRAPGEEKSEFLTSTDQWFRPTNLALGPDGAIYIVDMYREIIEDYSAIPRYLQQQYGLIEGNDRGRIWRIVRSPTRESSEPEDPRCPPPDTPGRPPSTDKLIACLSHPNAWWRQTAQRLLIQRNDPSAVGPLESIARDGKTPQARLHALYTLDGLEALAPDIVEHAIADPHYAVRLHALRLCEPWLDKRPSLLEAALKGVDDPDPRVRLQLAMTLGESQDERALSALARLAARDGADEWMRAAILSAVVDSADRLLSAIVQPTDEPGESRHLLQPLAAVVGARRRDDEIGNLLKTITEIDDDERTEIQPNCLNGLIEGLHRGKTQPLTSTVGQRALRGLLTMSSADVRVLALRVAGLVKLADSPEMKTAFANAASEALDDGLPIEARRAAITLLASAPYKTLADTVRRLLDPRQPLDLQLAAVGALSSAEAPDVASVLLANYSGYTPKVRAVAIEAIFSRTNRLPGLLDAIKRGTVSAQSLGAFHRVQLLENPNPQVRRTAASLLAGQVPQKSRELFERYQSALTGPRDAGRGEAVFKKECAICHQLKGQGQRVGPDLTATNNRPDETLLLDILQPSNQITSGFRSYVVIDTGGRVFTGVLASESATSITLRNASDGTTSSGDRSVVERTVLRKDIEEMQASDQSLMPDDIYRLVSPQETADLIAWLRRTLGPASPNALTLFEDDRSFAASLDQGAGAVAIETEDHFSGTVSLAVTAPIRYSPRIPDWQYRVVESPGVGEFRYLRFAWKSRDGVGVMIELADDGSFPPNSKPIRRYHSGKNTTTWKSLEVSSQTPTEWVVVTCDLWKDFGQFTLTGIALNAFGGTALFDRIELLRSLDSVNVGQ